jgi:hypothetical protein
MPRKLKVFRTPIGFHDAYVAAPSRKAALEAWGSTADLFARGGAEEVTDPQLTAEALKRPGEVIRVSRGDLQAQLKALGPKRTSSKSARDVPEAKPARRRPPPTRDKMDRAETALAEAQASQDRERASLEKERDAIERKLEAAQARQERQTAQLAKRLEKAKADYHAALEKWSG